MESAKELLNKIYLIEEQGEFEEIYLDDHEAREIDLACFVKLKRIYVSQCLNEKELNFKELFPKVKIIECSDAQKWLNEKYPNKQGIKKISLNDSDNDELKIEGRLVINDFPQLEEIVVEKNFLTHLQIINCPQLRKILCGDNRLGIVKQRAGLNVGQLEKFVMFDQLDKLSRLSCQNNFLTKLDLSCFSNLETIDCSDNRLVKLKLGQLDRLVQIACGENNLKELDVTGCTNLKKLYCYDNLLTNLDLSQNLKLEKLSISNNSFSEQGLNFLSHLVNLESLGLGNDWNELRTNHRGLIYNRFVGGLEPLKNMTKLNDISIDNTDINSGLEYLPGSIEYFSCSADQKEDAGVQHIYSRFIDEELGEVGTDENGYINKEDFWQSLSVIKQSLKNKIYVEGMLVKEKITSDQLTRKLLKDGHFADLNWTWQNYIDSAQNLSEVRVYKVNVVVAIQNLKETISREKQIQELLQKEKLLFEKQEAEVSYLEDRVQELTQIIKIQKEKIIQAFLRILPERELLRDLIITHLEFIRFKEQEVNSPDYDEKCDDYIEKCQKIKKQLRSKLDKETMNGIQAILTDCENLVRDELELETKLSDKINLIEEQKQLLHLTSSCQEKEKNLIQSHQEIHQDQLQQLQRQFQEEKNQPLQLLYQISLAKVEGESKARKECFEMIASKLGINITNAFSPSNANNATGKATNNQGFIAKNCDSADFTNASAKDNTITTYQEEMVSRTKRQLSISSQTVPNNNKQVKLDQDAQDWIDINSDFTPELIQRWKRLGFTVKQCRDWMNINSVNQREQEIQTPEFYAWLRDIKNLTAEQILNNNNINSDVLKQEFQTRLQAQIIHNPPKN